VKRSESWWAALFFGFLFSVAFAAILSMGIDAYVSHQIAKERSEVHDAGR